MLISNTCSTHTSGQHHVTMETVEQWDKKKGGLNICLTSEVRKISDELFTLWGNLLDVGVGADDVLDLVGVRVLEGEAAGSDQHPFPVLHPETVHHRQNLSLQLHNLQVKVTPEKKNSYPLFLCWKRSKDTWGHVTSAHCTPQTSSADSR